MLSRNFRESLATPRHTTMEQVEEPPYISNFSDKLVLHFLDTPLILPNLSQTQHVERLIQVITKIGTRAATVESRLREAVMVISTLMPQLKQVLGVGWRGIGSQRGQCHIKSF
jgi:hypothetical protein